MRFTKSEMLIKKAKGKDRNFHHKFHSVNSIIKRKVAQKWLIIRFIEHFSTTFDLFAHWVKIKKLM